MKKILLTALVLGIGIANAQHYLLAFVNAGENPGAINTEDEQPSAFLTGNYTGYTQILAPAASGWSAQQTIPFSFAFNGNDYTQYYASSSGVVTFSSTVGTAPASTNAALPDASIPDNSICAWGLNLSGANDAVMAKTFGTSPNRQHWVIWASVSVDDFAGGWSYWGIVMEETSNKAYVVDMRSYSPSNGNTSLTVGLQYDNSTALSVSQSPNVTSGNTATGGSEFTAIDNTYYMFAPGVQPAVDLELNRISLAKYVSSGATAQITGRVRNLGANAVSSFDISWTDGTTVHTNTVTGNINSGAFKTFTCTDQVDPAPGVVTTITVTAEIVGDADLTNNSKSTTTSESAFTPTKVVFGEEATGTWCGWCPRGSVWMETMAENYPETWIGVAVHNGDPMVNTTYDSWIGTRIGGYPSGLIDRDPNEADPSEFEARYDDAIDNFGVADITVDAYMDLDRNVEVTIGAHFAISSTDAMRLAGVVIEDNLTGTSSDWAQANYYSGGASGTLSGAGHDWHTAPNPVPASDMEYDHVGRELLGGIDGDAGSVPAAVGSDDLVEYTYSFTLDNDYNEANITIAGILIDNASGAVLNAGGATLTYEYEEGGVTYLMVDGQPYESWDGNWVPLGTAGVDASNISLFPNPATNVININGIVGLSNVVIYNALGSVVLNTTIDGNVLDIQDVPAGVYSIAVTNNGVTSNDKITVVK